MTIDNWAMINVETNRVDSVVVWDGNLETWAPPEGYIMVIAGDAGIGWTYVDGVFIQPPVIPPTPEEVLASQSAKLQAAIQLAAAQKNALTERISQINDAIDFGDVTPAEEAELPVRTSQLAAWKRYATLLGRVTAQAGWYETVVWPAQPTEGMDLTVSAVAKPVQAS
jgi:hypothetical protein